MRRNKALSEAYQGRCHLNLTHPGMCQTMMDRMDPIPKPFPQSEFLEALQKCPTGKKKSPWRGGPNVSLALSPQLVQLIFQWDLNLWMEKKSGIFRVWVPSLDQIPQKDENVSNSSWKRGKFTIKLFPAEQRLKAVGGESILNHGLVSFHKIWI